MEFSISNFMSIGILFLFHALVVGAVVFETDDAIVVKGTLTSINICTLESAKQRTCFGQSGVVLQ